MKTARFRLGWNPLVIKELRSRMRGARAFIVLTAFLLLLSLMTYCLYATMVSTVSYGGPPLLSAYIGQAIFSALALFELLLVCFITPALTSGSISGERERLTYDMLLATPLRPHSMLWGKFVSALVYVLLLIFAAVPMASLVFVFGGVAPGDLVGVLVVLLITAVTFGAVGLFLSAFLGRTGRATVISYAIVIALVVGTALVYIFWGIIRAHAPPRGILYLNPFVAMGSALGLTEPSGPLWNGPQAVLLLPFMLPLMGFGSEVPGLEQASLRPIWQYTVLLYAGLTLLCYLLSTQLVKPVRRWRIGRRGALLLALILLLYGGAAYAFFREDGLAAWRAPPRQSALDARLGIDVQQPMVVTVPAPIPPPTLAVAVPPTPTPTRPANTTPTPLAPSLDFVSGECRDIPDEELLAWEGVEVAASDGAVVVNQNLRGNCCGQIEATLEAEGNTLRIVETGVGEECDCLCGYQVRAEIWSLSAGKYRVEVVWQSDDQERSLGEGEVVIDGP